VGSSPSTSTARTTEAIGTTTLQHHSWTAGSHWNGSTEQPGAWSGTEGTALVLLAALLALVLLTLLVAAGWALVKVRQKRRLEGRYCPAVEEKRCAVHNLPHLPRPNIEGLI